MLKAGFIGAGGRSQGAHYPSVNRLEDDVEMLGACAQASFGHRMTRILQLVTSRVG